MIVTFPWPIKTLSGINHDRTLVYRSCRGHSVCIASVYVCPRITEHNHRQGSKLKQANVLFKSMSAGFVEDLQRYADAFGKQLCLSDKMVPNYYNIFIKALCNGAVKIEDLDSLELFVGKFGNNIEAWMANGLLPRVKARFLGVCVVEVAEVVEVEVSSAGLVVVLFFGDFERQKKINDYGERFPRPIWVFASGFR